MESAKIEGYVVAAMSDAFGITLKQPPVALAGLLASDLFLAFTRRKFESSKGIFLEEMRKGERFPSEAEYDTFFGLIYRYADAVKRGTAERNLRLMAQVISKGASTDCGFTPDVLASHLNVLADLRRDEIKVLSSLWRNCKRVATGDEIGRNIEMTENTCRQLVPSIFPNDNEYYACVSAITRTGLIYEQKVFDGGFGLSNRFHEIVSLCNLSDLAE